MDEAPEHRTGMSAGHWLGLGCGALLAVAAMVVIGLVNARRPAAPRPVAIRVAAAPAAETLTAVEAQPDRDPFARDGGAVPTPDDEGEPGADEGEPGGENTPPQPVMPLPGPVIDEPPMDDSPVDIPEPSVRPGRGNRDGGDGDPGDGGDAAPVTKPSKPKMPTVAELKPHDPKEPPAWALPPQAAEGGLELVAVIAGREPQAVFRKEGAYRRVRLGETIEGLKIERIDTTGVYLKDGDHRFLIRMPATIRPGGQRGTVASAPRAQPAREPEPDSEPVSETPAAPSAPMPELTPLPPLTGPAGRGGLPGGQRPGGWQRPGGAGGGQGGGQGSGQAGRRRPPPGEGDGDQ